MANNRMTSIAATAVQPFSSFTDRRERFEVIVSTPDMIHFRWSHLEDDSSPVDTIGKYHRVRLTEIGGPFFLKDRVTTDPENDGALPHGYACYIPEWDIILIRPHVFEGTPPLTKKAFTILAHEIGHREAYRTGRYTPALSCDQNELLAWRICQELFTGNPLLDTAETAQRIADYERDGVIL